MDTIRYDFASIEGSRMDIAQSAARLNNALDELKSYLAPLVATWEGEAADAYPGAAAKMESRPGRS